MKQNPQPKQLDMFADSLESPKNNDITLLCGDSLQLLSQIDPVDCIITDPAYWTLNKWRSIGTTTRLGGHRDSDKREGWFETISPDGLRECLKLWAGLLPKNGHCWVMCDDETSDHITGFFRNAKSPCGFDYVKRFPLLKMTSDGLNYRQGMGYHGRASHEYVVLLEKGRRRFNNENFPDIFSFPWTGDKETRAFTEDNKPYPTAKPIALYRFLLELSTLPGETALDPFCGSGGLGVAALETSRKAICIDINPAAIRCTEKRIAHHLSGGSTHA